MAICVFRYDKVAKLYEADWIVIDNNTEKGIKSLYLSSSPEVENRDVRYAIGSVAVDKLYNEYIKWREKNNKNGRK